MAGARSYGISLAVGLLKRLRPVLRRPAVWVVIVGLMAGIFVFDTVTQIEIAAPVLYVIPVLLAAATRQRPAIWIVGAAAALVTLLSAAMTPVANTAVGGINGALSLFAIGATTVLAVRGETAARALQAAQADLARLSRVMTINEVSTTIAHEVSQPLAAIVANASAAARWLTSPNGQDEARRALECVGRDAERAGIVIDRVRGLARRVPPVTAPVDLGAVLDDALALVWHGIDTHRIEVRRNLPPDLPRVRADRVQLQQVLINLLLNGIDSLGQVKDERRLLVVDAVDDRGSVRVEIRDTGVGFAAASEDNLFMPFYTTKPDGIGVGLAISRSIVELHGGAIFAARQHPRGAMFGFTVPCAGHDE